MADAVLSPLLSAIVGALADAAIEEVKLALGVDEEFENLTSTLKTIQAVLHDAEDMEVKSEAVNDWLQKLKDVAYDADDLVDEFLIESQRSKMESEVERGKKQKQHQQVCNFVSSCFSCNKIRFRWESAHKIKDINERLDKIAKQRHDLHLNVRDGDMRPKISEHPKTSSIVDELEVFGRDNEKEEIIKSLFSDASGTTNNKRNVSVTSVVGMGGLGKTTLAQVAYNDEEVKKHFGLRAWVCVSEDFDVKRLTKEIIESATSSTRDFSSIDPMQRLLQETLNGKRFLIVLDDVWNEDYSRWEQLRGPFSVGAQGSKVLVTARSETVSAVMQPTFTYRLNGLPNNDCWSLFTRRAFADHGRIDDHPDLSEIGKKIVDRCEGLPLAVKAMGGLLYGERDVRVWEHISNSEIWNLPGEASKILPALRLSYHHLPAHLKPCFSFCSIYSKDHELEKNELVQLWIAHGFIRPKDGQRIEDIGSEYLHDLLSRSFFQYSKPGRYRMHDMIHDLADSISRDECFRIEDGNKCSDPKKVRHLSLASFDVALDSEGEVNFEAYYEFKSLRTFFAQYYFNQLKDVPRQMFEKLKFLRALDLRRNSITELPNSIGSLKHLRYLNLNYTDITRLPESVCDIYNLQTLNLNGCSKLTELPKETWKLINLRHLDIAWCSHIHSMPPEIGRLTSLQTLPKFIVGSKKGQTIEELKEIADIHGDIEISKLENVAKATEAQRANLKNKPFLESLRLLWSLPRKELSLQDERVEEDVLQCLQPHPNLKKLYVYGYAGTCLPSWMKKMEVFLVNLVHVELYSSKCMDLPPLGQLPYLKVLHISDMVGIKKISREICGTTAKLFPLLEDLELMYMTNLEEWCGFEEGDFPCLRKIEIKSCEKLRQLSQFLPLLQSLEELVLIRLANLEGWCGVGEVEFPHLRKLKIIKCPKVTTWPLLLPALTKLSIWDCHGFVALPPLPSLCKLSLTDCNERLLNSVTCFPSLSSLDINIFRGLKSIPQGILQALTQLKELYIMDCEELVSLQNEDDLQEDDDLPSTLTTLLLHNCSNLKALPRRLHLLTSLENLYIRYCPQLSSLPEGGLPTNLECLVIFGCPNLQDRYPDRFIGMYGGKMSKKNRDPR